MTTRAHLALLAATGGAIAACAAIVGLPDVPTPASPSADGGDAGAEASGDASACSSLSPPPRPAQDDPSTDPEQSFVVAIRSVDFGAPLDGGTSRPFGYDLDRTATCCDQAPESCVPATGTTHCDADGGRDNSGGDLLASLSLVSPDFASNGVNQRIAAGLYTLLFQVQHYNGTRNDAKVTVGLLSSRGIARAPGADAAPPPAWDGNDTWTIDSDFVLGSPDASPIVPGRFDSDAYVSGGVLVASVDDLPISLGVTGGNTVVVTLRGGVLTGELVASGSGGYRLQNAQIAGRFATRALLAEFPSVFINGSFVCPGTSTYSNLKSLVCKAADIAADPKRDGTGAPCDALSVGIGFAAEPARTGGVVAPTRPPVNCRDAAPDDCPR